MRLSAVLLLASIGSGCATHTSTPALHSARESVAYGPRPTLEKAYGRIPLYFEANVGQTDARVRFLARGRGYTTFLTDDEAVLVFSTPTPREKNVRNAMFTRRPYPDSVSRTALRLRFVGASKAPHVSGRDRLPGSSNYFKGKDPAKWRADVPNYERVQYENLYPGIDVTYYGNPQQLEYDVIIQPHADPRRVALKFEGTNRIELNRDGDLILHIAGGSIRQPKPFIYQEADSVRRAIPGGYAFREDGSIGFEIGRYDSSRPLVVDPAVLFYSTYLGGSAFDLATGIAVDAAGSAYVAGYTASADFPTTAGAFQTASAGDYDAFVTKLNSTGSGLIYSTYLGGNSFDSGGPVTFDAAGNAYVGGTTYSSDFPTTVGALDGTVSGGDGFVTKLTPAGSALVYSTVIGGGSDDSVYSMALDAAGSASLAGATSSADFPTSLLAYDTSYNGGFEDGFVAKIDSAGSTLVYSTYLGGDDDDFVNALVIDANGTAYVSGSTASMDFPTTAAAFDVTFNGGYDAFVTKFNALGSGVLYSTFLGGTLTDGSSGLALDASGTAYVGGSTQSSDFPTTAGTMQSTIAGGFDGFISRVNAGGSGLVFSTYLGGSGDEFGGSTAVDVSGNIFLTLATSSTDLPIVGAFQPANAGNIDVFVAKIESTGDGLVYSTYLGGSDLDAPQQIAIDALPIPNAYVAGVTHSVDIPISPGAFQSTLAGSGDGLVSKIAEGDLVGGPFIDRVTGGGTINVVGGIGSFSFMVQRSSTGVLSGRLQYFNHVSATHVRSQNYATLLIVGNTATFDGDCTVNGAPCTFTVNVTDNGEPGTTDTFTISVSGGPTEGGTLRSGNILIQ